MHTCIVNVMLQSAGSRCEAAFKLGRGREDQHGRRLSSGDLEFEAGLDYVSKQASS